MAQRSRLTQGRPAGDPAAAASRPERPTGLTGRDAAMARRRQIIGAPIGPAAGETPRGDDPGRSPARGLARAPGAAPSPLGRPGTAGSTEPGSRRPTAVGRGRSPMKAATLSRGRRLSMARRAATAAAGRNGLKALGHQSSPSAAATLWREAGASSREIARQVRQERCEHGKSCATGARPSGRLRPNGRSGRGTAAADGASATAGGRQVTGTRLGRSTKTTGDEPGVCARVTGTEYLGAEVFQDFCASAAEPRPRSAPAGRAGGQPVTGTRAGRGIEATSDEAHAVRALTGTPYTGSDASGGPVKVGVTRTFSGGAVTGTLLGRGARVTGDEPGSCRLVTGNEYVGAEQYTAFCATQPEPSGGKKVGTDATWHGRSVTGTRVGRAPRVTGDEPGTCEIVTGTPYVGPAQYDTFCPPPAGEAAARRVRSWRDTPGAGLTGQSPGLGGGVTGDERGACLAVSGTPYVGADQYFAECGQGADSTPGSADFPQPLTGGNWGAFSVRSPARAAQATRASGLITGTSYPQDEGRITGPFNLGRGVVTGTEDFRRRPEPPSATTALPSALHPAPTATARSMPPSAPHSVEGSATGSPAESPRPRVTGEGLDGGTRITGDDWGRNERVTGTEGRSASARNPSRRGATVGAFAGARTFQESQARQTPPQRVTGSSGSTERGALVTVSGGARA
jgi:hypothetical protein